MMTKTDIVIDNAMAAFWASVAKAYPQIKSGDLSPDTVLMFEKAANRALSEWLEFNTESEEGLSLAAADMVLIHWHYQGRNGNVDGILRVEPMYGNTASMADIYRYMDSKFGNDALIDAIMR